MNKGKANKEVLLESVAKMATDKAIIRSFLKGKIAAETLTENGIRLARPI